MAKYLLLFFALLSCEAKATNLFFDSFDQSLNEEEIVQYDFVSLSNSVLPTLHSEGSIYIKKNGDFLLEAKNGATSQYTLKFENEAFFELSQSGKDASYKVYSNPEELPLAFVINPLRKLQAGVVGSIMDLSQDYEIKITFNEITLSAKTERSILKKLSFNRDKDQTFIKAEMKADDAVLAQNVEVSVKKAAPTTENLALKFILQVPDNAVIARIN